MSPEKKECCQKWCLPFYLPPNPPPLTKCDPRGEFRTGTSKEFKEVCIKRYLLHYKCIYHKCNWPHALIKVSNTWTVAKLFSWKEHEEQLAACPMSMEKGSVFINSVSDRKGTSNDNCIACSHSGMPEVYPSTRKNYINSVEHTCTSYFSLNKYLHVSFKMDGDITKNSTRISQEERCCRCWNS